MNTYYAGWDGGGTGTTVECVDAAGHTLLREKAGPLNPNGNPRERVAASVRAALAAMAALPGGLAACGGLCVATAGVSNSGAAALLTALVREGGYAGPLRLAGDQESALAGALEGAPGMILLAGTGSICTGRGPDGAIYRSGGWGHLIDDEGSGYAIGRDVLAAVVQAEDGRAAPTLLTGLVFGQLGIGGVGQLVTHLYQPGRGKADIAAFAPLCTAACEAGDAAALAIQEKAAEGLYALAAAVARRLGMNPLPTALAGSILQKDPGVRAGLLARMEASGLGFAPCEPAADAAHGAALMAWAGQGAEAGPGQ